MTPLQGPDRQPAASVCLRCGAVHVVGRAHCCGHSRRTRVRALWTRLTRKLTAMIAGSHSGRCGCPLCSRAERQVRQTIGMPLRHPERITRDLPDAQEELLALLADEMWPDDEYIAIIRETGQD